jgi:hypothetical protein
MLPPHDLPAYSIPNFIKEKITCASLHPFSIRQCSQTAGQRSSCCSLFPLAAHAAQAQSLGYEGPTGVFVTPLASVPPASPAKGLGQPSVAYHFLAAGPIVGDFSTVSITEGFAKRFEFGYTHEIHNEDGGSKAALGPALTPLWNSGIDIVHAKVNLVPDSYKKQKWIPAISVGGIYRTGDKSASTSTISPRICSKD